MAEYFTLALLKNLLKITDTDRDAQLTRAVDAANKAVEDHCQRRFDLDTAATARTLAPYRRVVDDPSGQRLLLDADIGSATDLAVEVGSGSSWTTVTSSVEAWPLNALSDGKPYTSLLLIGACWPSGPGQRARVTARWGWPSTPKTVAQAAQIQATRLAKRIDSPEGVLGSAEWGAIRVARVDPDVVALLAPYVAPWAR